MAVQIYKPQWPLNKALRHFIDDAEEAFQPNMDTQKVWPNEVYPGYAKKNAHRKAKGWHHSTGLGYRSMTARVLEANPKGNIMIGFSHPRYMMYPDLGVGKGRHIDDVNSDSKANYKRRFVKKWSPQTGDTQRPFLMMEIRHVEKRLGGYMEDYYGESIATRTLELVTMKGHFVKVTDTTTVGGGYDVPD